MGTPVFAALLKPVELAARVDPLSGQVIPDPVSLGVSPSDEAALEWALRCAERHGGSVRALAAGEREPAEVALRLAAAAGAAELAHVSLDPDWPSDWVGRSLAQEMTDVALAWCGDMSLDRGSGSVPAFVAAELGWPQALGLVGVELPAGPGESFEVLRRLDGGRRERLLVTGPAVLSVEGATARLRRAGFSALLAANREPAPVKTVPGRVGRTARPAVGAVSPYRPPARVVPPPAGDTAGERIRSLIGLEGRPVAHRSLHLAPAEAAAMIIESLESWGEL